MDKNGCGYFGRMNLKLTIFKKGADVINCFFACWYSFRQSLFDFWVGVVENGHGLLVYETLKAVLS